LGPPAEPPKKEATEEEPTVKEVEQPPTELVVSCFKCRKSMNESDAVKFDREGEIFYSCEEHDPDSGPAAKDAYWTNIETDLEKWREEMLRVDLEDKFYDILGVHGYSNIAEVIGGGDKKAVQTIFSELGRARHPE
jgi:hypothetical protein